MQEVMVNPTAPPSPAHSVKKKRASVFQMAHGLRPTRGHVLFDTKALRLTLRDRRVIARYGKAAPTGPNVHSATCTATDFLNLILGRDSNEVYVYMHGLLIEANDGFRIRKHIPTAVIATGEGAVILDLQNSFYLNFLTYAMVEQAGDVFHWRTEIRETLAKDNASLMAAAMNVAAEFRVPQIIDSCVGAISDEAGGVPQRGSTIAADGPARSTNHEPQAARLHFPGECQRDWLGLACKPRRELAAISE